MIGDIIGRVFFLDGRALDRWYEASNHDSIRVIGTRVLADGRLKVSRT